MYTLKLKGSSDKLSFRLVWLHGWGQSHKALVPLAEYFDDVAENYLVDFPGFGFSSEPKEVLDTEDYADILADFLSTLPFKDTILVSHSFGGRVAIELAFKYPHLVKGMVLISSPGLPLKRSIFFKIKAFFIKKMSQVIRFFLCLKRHSLLGKLKLGSIDYREATPMMRKILVKAVNKDLSVRAMQISCPVLLLYGSKDTATPPYIGQRFKELIKGSKYIEFPLHDHYTILTSGKSLVENQIEEFLAEIR